jgi:hypothetical protein
MLELKAGLVTFFLLQRRNCVLMYGCKSARYPVIVHAVRCQSQRDAPLIVRNRQHAKTAELHLADHDQL